MQTWKNTWMRTCMKPARKFASNKPCRLIYKITIKHSVLFTCSFSTCNLVALFAFNFESDRNRENINICVWGIWTTCYQNIIHSYHHVCMVSHKHSQNISKPYKTTYTRLSKRIQNCLLPKFTANIHVCIIKSKNKNRELDSRF